MSAQALNAAKEAFAALPEARRAELEARFDLARLQAQHHTEYTRHVVGPEQGWHRAGGSVTSE